jgi:pimeloyl-ACP methyl ester carboxylesterase
MTVAYEVSGSGPLVLLVHEGVADRRMWRHQIPVLAREHTVVAVDLRGFGESPNASGPFSHVDDLRDVLDELAVARATVVGGSFGGRVVLELALSYPECVERLVLCPPALRGWEWSEVVREGWRAEEEAYEAGDLDRATEINVELWAVGPNRRPEEVDPQVCALVRTMQRHAFELPWPDPPPEEAELDPPASELLAEISVPTLVVVGAEDVEDFQRIAALVADAIPGARNVVIPGAAHVVALERPEEFNRALLAFLRETATYTSSQ